MKLTDQQNAPKFRFPDFTESWETAPISDWLSKVIDYRGKAPPKTETGVPLITARNVKMGHLDFEADEYIDSELFETWMNRGRPDPGDVMFTTEAPLGNVAQFPSKGTYALGQRIITLQANKDRCDSGFLFQNLLGPKLQRKVDARGTGSTAKGIKSRLFVKIPMSAPSLPEQRKIAKFLGSVDTKIRQLAKKKWLLEDYKNGCMQQLFSQTIRFKNEDGKDFPDWEKRRLGNVVTIKKGQQLNRDDMIEDGAYPVINGGISASGFTDTFNTKGGVITVSEGGNSCGYIDWQAKDFWLGGHCYALPIKDHTSLPQYLLHFLKNAQSKIMALRVGSGLPNIQKRDLEKLLVSLPHPNEQRKIADFLSALDQKIELVGKELEHAKTFKKGLLQQMFV